MKKGEDAFTLLELIISLSIGAVLILIVSFAVRMGFFQMEKGSKWLDASHRERSASQFISQQVSSMRKESVGEEVIFEGDSNKILFVTPISLEKRYGLGLMTVLYYQEKDGKDVRLSYKEKRFIPAENADKFKDKNNKMFESSEKITIFDGYEEINFMFLGELESENESIASNPTNSNWKDSWSENSLPRAIKLMMSKNGKSREVIAPVMVMY
jgi:prepilin-type N-terminal cleavage/methylation domain-containing protein